MHSERTVVTAYPISEIEASQTNAGEIIVGRIHYSDCAPVRSWKIPLRHAVGGRVHQREVSKEKGEVARIS